MKNQLAIFALAILMGVLGFAVAGVAVASNGNPPSPPPGQGDCDHGNGDQRGSAGPCKEDPSENGKDCEAHGKNGGVNEDHCKGEDTTPTETTPTETTPTETTPTETTPSSSNTPPATTPQETTPEQSSPPESTSPTSPPTIVGTPPKAQHSSAQAEQPAKAAVAGVGAKSAPKPTRAPQSPPFTL
jgi:hypothetical protein